MPGLILYVKFLFGLAALFGGAVLTVRHGAALARGMGVSKFLIGVIFIGFGTSLPEGVVSWLAAVNGSSDIALGNVIGSNIANAGLILGLAALLNPVRFSKEHVKYQVIFLIVSGLLVFGFLQDHHLSRPEGGILFLLGVAAVWLLIRGDDALAELEEHLSEQSSESLSRSVLYILGGMALLIVGAHFLVSAAVEMARQIGLPEWVIGVTLVAIGTSLPELASAVVASHKKEGAFVVGNIVGSNILNVCLILSVAVLIRPIQVVDAAFFKQLVFFLGFTILPALVLLKVEVLSRVAGAVLVVAYMGYLCSVLIGL